MATPPIWKVLRQVNTGKLFFDTYDINFRRERFGDYPNNFLNYGYAILRAATARALSGSGLLNTLGIHHKSKYNAFALADDIMEPFRPLVDEKVFEIMQQYDEQELNTKIKAELLQVLTRTVYFKDEKSPLMVALQKTASSLQQCFMGNRKKNQIPQIMELNAYRIMWLFVFFDLPTETKKRSTKRFGFQEQFA